MISKWTSQVGISQVHPKYHSFSPNPILIISKIFKIYHLVVIWYDQNIYIYIHLIKIYHWLSLYWLTWSPSHGHQRYTVTIPGPISWGRHILKHLPILLRVWVWQIRPGMGSKRTGNDRKTAEHEKKNRKKPLEKRQLVGSVYMPQMLYIWKIYLHLGHCGVNVGKYSIHGASRICSIYIQYWLIYVKRYRQTWYSKMQHNQAMKKHITHIYIIYNTIQYHVI